ncbi:MAG: ATP-binding protein [Acidobacteriota bacterium]
MQEFEKLGMFYLGRQFDLQAGAPAEGLLLYDSQDLVTHAVCVGMTGSGKTGLCVSLIEEAAIDGIPAIVIDPKGDLANLLLTFPELRGSDFLPWIDPEESARKGINREEHADQVAARWRKGLSEWGQSGQRIQKLRDAADFAIYTPGSTAGIPVSVLKSLSPPGGPTIEDDELLVGQVEGATTSLLGLLGIEADPIQSREHILLASLIRAAWKEGRSLSLESLIQQIQSPPFSKVGVLDLETFYPSKDRFGLAMRLNNLLASPGFEAWLEGEPLEVGSILRTSQGKPRIAIFSIAHLNDSERMFFVSMLLNRVLSWMRSQAGTSSLRALVYMDEIFGYFPPVANPPSKTPLLTLLKQARAFGVGVVLATQNPVDLDYKGLSNAGTWFIGRLQTERDKARVLEGLEGAAAGAGRGFDRQSMEQTLAGLGNRVFLMNNVHEDAPEIFQTRWALSYLRGPLTRLQIKSLMEGYRPPLPAGRPEASEPPAASPAAGIPEQFQKERPVLPPDVLQFFVPVRSHPASGAQLVYRPSLLAQGSVYYADPMAGADFAETVSQLIPFQDGATAVDWSEAQNIEVEADELEPQPAQDALYLPPPPAAQQKKNFESWKKSFSETLYRGQKLELLESPALKQISKPGESERDFRIRVIQAAHEQRDFLKEKIRTRYAGKVATIQDRIRRAAQSVEKETEQARQAKMQTAISFGTTLLGTLFGRKTLSMGTLGRATTAARGVGRSLKESQDIKRAEENVEALQQQLTELENQIRREVEAIEAQLDPLTAPLQTVVLKPKKTNITVKLVVLAWAPHWLAADGSLSPAWQ